MAVIIDSLGKAGRFGMIVRAECASCGNTRFYRATDLALHFGIRRDPQSLHFRCDRCVPKVIITVLEIHQDRLPKMTVWRPHPPLKPDGPVVWMPERLR